jgi:hypothetical protein
MARIMYLLTSDNLVPEIGCNSWAEAISEDLRAIGKYIQRIPAFPIRISLTSFALQEPPPYFLIEDEFKNLKKGWGCSNKVAGRQGVVSYLKAIKRRRPTPYDEQYCMIRLIGKQFFSPCPGEDWLGLTDHDHVDNDFLAACKKHGYDFWYKGPCRRFRSDPEAYYKKELAKGWWRERRKMYLKRVKNT